MKWDISFRGTVQKFPGKDGWTYVAVPQKYTAYLKQKRHVWGMYPIIAHIRITSWKTKLMMKKGGDFFVALKEAIREKEQIHSGDRITVYLGLDARSENLFCDPD